MSALLYQFPVSHYCEKARWALDHKGVNYEVSNLLPGLHIFKVRKLASDDTVPVLEMGAQFIQGSDKIIDYLDESYSRNLLTPSNTKLKQEAIYWEKFASQKLGDPLRLISYYYYLNHPQAVIDRFTEDGPWYGRLFYTFTIKQVSERIRAGYSIADRTAEHAKLVVQNAMASLAQHLENNNFMVGEYFSRADLAICALLSPFVLPTKGYVRQDNFIPDELAAYRQSYIDHPVFAWVNRIYDNFR